jgi:16S rRNA (guanine527-N7)-methyltransferase
MTLERTLDEGLAALALHADARMRERLLAYARLLEKWNKVYNLTAVRDIEAMMTHHLLDSLAVIPHLIGARLIDVGSGGGLPGVPIAIMRPDMRVTLLDSNHKKAAFLRQAAIELDLGNASVVCDRAESWRPAQPYDVVISRAFAELSQFVAAAGHLCSDDGVIVAMKGVYPDEELGAVPSGYRLIDVRRIVVPGLAADRHLVLLQPTAVAAESN